MFGEDAFTPFGSAHYESPLLAFELDGVKGGLEIFLDQKVNSHWMS